MDVHFPSAGVNANVSATAWSVLPPKPTKRFCDATYAIGIPHRAVASGVVDVAVHVALGSTAESSPASSWIVPASFVVAPGEDDEPHPIRISQSPHRIARLASQVPCLLHMRALSPRSSPSVTSRTASASGSATIDELG